MDRTILGIMLIAGCTLLAACSSLPALPPEPGSTPTGLTATLQPVSTQTASLSQLGATQTQSASLARTRVALTVRSMGHATQVQQTIRALTPSPTRLTLTPTATIDYAPYLDSWLIYTNQQYGFLFEYQSIWDLSPFERCGIVEHTQDLPTRTMFFYMRLGYRGEFAIYPASGMTRDAFVNQWILGHTLPDEWELEDRENKFINGLGATFIAYRFGGLGRYGESYFFNANDKIFLFNLTAGGFCEFPEIDLHETDLFWHAVNTFSFITPTP